MEHTFMLKQRDENQKKWQSFTLHLSLYILMTHIASKCGELWICVLVPCF